MSLREIDAPLYTILNGVSATGQGQVVDVTKYRNVVVAVGTSGSADCTIQVQGSIENKKNIDFSLPASETNMWSYITAGELSGSSVPSTGIVFSGTDGVKLFELNTNGIRTMTLNVTAYSAGQITSKVRLFSD